MKNVNKLFVLIISLLLLSPTAKASHTAGGELVYVWLSDSTYRFLFKYIRDCTGISEPSTHTLCINPTPAIGSSCPGLTSISMTMNKWAGTITGGMPNGGQVSTGCPGPVTKCDNSSAILQGYREWWYSAIVTLPGKCNFWTFSVNAGTRNMQDNLANQGNMHIEATLNNVLFQGNSSPTLMAPHWPWVPINAPQNYNNAAVDPDSDSLNTEIVMPQNTTVACPPTVTAAGLQAGLNIPNNPFPVASTFTLNQITGHMAFAATTLGKYTLASKVSEYRNGILVGYITREMQIMTITASPAPPTVATTLDQPTLTGCTYSGGIIYGKPGQPMSFCFDVEASASNSRLIIQDNSIFVFPGSSVIYTNMKDDSVRGCFSWTPPLGAKGIRVFTMLVKDSNCTLGLAPLSSFSYLISLDSPVAVKNMPAANTGTVIYPNPAQNDLHISSNIKYTTAYITNSVGQILDQQKIDPAEKTINIRPLPAGFYYLKLRGENGKTETLKFSKQ